MWLWDPLPLTRPGLGPSVKQELCPKSLFRTTRWGRRRLWAPRGTYIPPRPVNSVATSSSAVLNPMKPPKGTRQPNKPRVRPTSSAALQGPGLWQLWTQHRLPDQISDCLWSVPRVHLQPANLDLGLNVNCQEAQDRKHRRAAAQAYNPKKMYLTENFIALVRWGDFLEARGWTSSTWATTASPRSRTAQPGTSPTWAPLPKWQQDRRLSPELFYGLQVCSISSSNTTSSWSSLGLSAWSQTSSCYSWTTTSCRPCPQASSQAWLLLRLNLQE